MARQHMAERHKSVHQPKLTGGPLPKDTKGKALD
jgi:hypothetical protein